MNNTPPGLRLVCGLHCFFHCVGVFTLLLGFLSVLGARWPAARPGDANALPEVFAVQGVLSSLSFLTLYLFVSDFFSHVSTKLHENSIRTGAFQNKGAVCIFVACSPSLSLHCVRLEVVFFADRVL